MSERQAAMTSFLNACVSIMCVSSNMKDLVVAYNEQGMVYGAAARTRNKLQRDFFKNVITLYWEAIRGL